MSWFDGLILLLVGVVALYEVRQEAGRALLDTVGTLIAVQISDLYAPQVTKMLHLSAMRGAEWAPQAYLLVFIPLLITALALSFLAHRQTRWSLDQYDPVFGMALGLCMAIALAHVTCDVAVESARLAYTKLPDYLQTSMFAEELRSFPTYHRVLAVLADSRSSR
jgi:uncharacterized membrane protein required for colicin V production